MILKASLYHFDITTDCYFHFKQVFILKITKRAHAVRSFGNPFAFAKLSAGDSTVLAVLPTVAWLYEQLVNLVQAADDDSLKGLCHEISTSQILYQLKILEVSIALNGLKLSIRVE